MNFLSYCKRSTLVRAFTLIEVMMATVILGLGILGLLALFAGTARQQQAASDATRSLQITRNAQAIIGANVGRLTDVDGDPLTGALALHFPDTWYPLVSVGSTALLTELIPADTTPGGLFFLADALEMYGGNYVLYRGSVAKYMQGQSAGFSNGTRSGPFMDDLFEFIDRRVEPCSLRTIEVQLARYNGVQVVTEPDVHRYNLAFVGAGGDFGENAYYIGPNHAPPMTGLAALPCGGSGLPVYPQPAFGPMADFIRIDIQNFENGNARASIQDMSIKLIADDISLGAGTLFVESVTITSPFQYRKSRLVSLNDRIIKTKNARGEFLPDLGYSLLSRRNAAGNTQVMAATYKIRRTESGSVFDPREAFSEVYNSGGLNSMGPLKKVQVLHGLDTDLSRQQYYIEVSTDADRWVVEPGTVFIVQGDSTAGGLYEGSEISTTVVSLVRRLNGNWRGYLNRAPRNNRRVLLTNITTAQIMDVWAVQPSIVSRDGSTWVLEGISIEPVLLYEDN